MSLLEVSDLSFTYSGSRVRALDGVSLEVERGEFVLITGGSPSGKSSLAYAIIGAIPHLYPGDYRGTVLVDGIKVSETSPREVAKVVGFVMQDPDAQLLEFKVRHEIANPLENEGVDPAEIRRRVAEMMRLLGIEHLAERCPLELSGGEKQKVAIAAALVKHPKLLILDEPASNLDPLSARQLYDLLARLNRELGLTILLIDHRLEVLASMVSRIVVMDSGRIVLDDEPERVLRRRELLRKLKIDAPGLFEELENPDPPPAGVTRREVARMEGVHFRYPDGTEALRGVNFRLMEGEFVALMGPNGSGKTTLAKHLNGLLKPQKGRVIVFGKDTRKVKASRLAWEVGYVFQFPAQQIFCDTVYDELAFTLRAKGEPEDRIRQKVLSIAERFGLADKLDRIPEELSIGELKRLMIASVLVSGCRLLILDEPLTGTTRLTIIPLLDDLRRRTREGLTVLMITHDVELAWRYADRVVVMRGGRIIADGPPAKVFADRELLEEANLEPPSGLLRRRAEVIAA